MKKNLFSSLIENIKTIFYALIIAVIIRSLFFQPFYIPSSSMEPTLLIGDRMDIANTPFHSVQQKKKKDSLIKNLTMEI